MIMRIRGLGHTVKTLTGPGPGLTILHGGTTPTGALDLVLVTVCTWAMANGSMANVIGTKLPSASTACKRSADVRKENYNIIIH